MTEEDALEPMNIRIVTPMVCEYCEKLVAKGQTMTAVAGRLYCDMDCYNRSRECK